MRILVESTGESLKVSLGSQAADAQVRGGPFSLLALGRPDPQAVLRRGAVEIGGDAELAEKFRELALLLQPDLEEELALLVGDVVAHRFGNLARGTVSWTQRAAATTLRNVAEYLAHESRDLVSRAEAVQLIDGVDTLREDVDRLAARVDALASR
jgi:ubiquinone biosynthesis protein UbiJ